jgi:hypothetical protein
MTVLASISNGSRRKEEGWEKDAISRGSKLKLKATYDDRRLSQNYVCGLERVERERSTADPRSRFLREEDGRERDEGYEDGCCASC